MNDPMLLWAKKARPGDADPAAFHPVLCHLLDVGAVAERLWADCLPHAARTWFADQTGLDVESAGRWAIFLAAMHDWGKAAPAFQERDRCTHPAKHGTISAYLLQSALTQEPFGFDHDVATRLARVAGGHHGIFPRQEDLNSAADRKKHLGIGRWRHHQTWLLEETARLLGIAGTPPLARLTNAGAIWLAGFISVADWIGSNHDFFPYAAPGGLVPDGFSSDAYLERARAQAARAIAVLGWSSWPARNEPRSWSGLFPYTPNAMQQQVIALAEHLTDPFLVIIEAPMGLGKTEAALYLADHANGYLGMRGHYLALPTQATSNQMFSRDIAFLQRRYPADLVNTQLLHGHAALDSEFAVLKNAARATLASFLEALDVQQEESSSAADDTHPGVIAAEWFTYRKRGLLAPFGVGTIDQALLAVLQTRHFFVRLLGLAGKTIVFDEVHAYDTYMSVLLARLLTWLRALGCSVVLLSATLPAARRAELLRVWSDASDSEVSLADPEPVAYPAITWRCGAAGGAMSFEVASKPIRLRWIESDQQGQHPNLGQELKHALRNGGCVAVICNTVKRAREVYTALQADFAGDEIELSLFHARFRYEERMARERTALRQFGKPAAETKRPDRAVIVATQVIEQSLDLDFDLMVTELAPVDLVLQRAGRLHRHDRDRPSGLAEPELWLLAPAEENELPVFSPQDRFVYDEHILLRSWLALREKSEIVIPDQLSSLIEEVYDDARACPASGAPGLGPSWRKTRVQLERERDEHESQARGVAIFPPSYRESSFFEQKNQTLNEDDPGTHETLRALTRLGEPSLTTIILTPEEWERLRPDAPDAAARAADLLRCSVNLSHPGVVKALLDDPECLPPSWKRSALLRHCRLLALDAAGEASAGAYRVYVDPALGVVVVRDGRPE